MIQIYLASTLALMEQQGLIKEVEIICESFVCNKVNGILYFADYSELIKQEEDVS